MKYVSSNGDFCIFLNVLLSRKLQLLIGRLRFKDKSNC